MTRRLSSLVLLLGLLPATAHAAVDSFKFGRFGTIPIVRPAGEPSQVVVLVSGDKGLGEREAAMAKALIASGAIVFEVDTVHYFSTAGKGEGRLFPAVDFESLSQIGQREAGLPTYRQPVLVGTGIGASLVYVALAEAPPHTFAGAVSDGFCAVIASDHLFRRGNGLKTDPNWPKPAIRVLPNEGVENPWFLLQTPGAACAAGAPTDFLKAIDSAKLIPAPAGVAPQDAWRKQLPQAMTLLTEKHRQEEAKLAARGPLRDLPLIEVPANAPEKNALAVIITGSGGYVGLDRKMGNQLSLRGVPVVALSSLAYFWKPRNPDGAAKDLATILDHYLAAWHKSRAILVGYSQGADVIPFMINRLPPPLRAKISVVGLIGLDGGAQFDYHPEGWITDRPQSPEIPVAPEVPLLKGMSVLCIYGEVEVKSLCKSLPTNVATVVEVPGRPWLRGRGAQARRALPEARGARAGSGGRWKGQEGWRGEGVVPDAMNAATRLVSSLGYSLWRPLLRRRLGRVALEEIDGVSLVVLPAVFNPAVFRTGTLLARAVAAWTPAADEKRSGCSTWGRGAGSAPCSPPGGGSGWWRWTSIRRPCAAPASTPCSTIWKTGSKRGRGISSLP